MNVSLEGKIIVITGAARGIGAAVAKQAAESGAAGLVLTDREPISLDLSCDVEEVRSDLLHPDAPKKIAQAAQLRFGKIDGLVNAAGLTSRGGVLDSDAALWDLVMAVNARAPFFLMSEVITDLQARSAPGSIVNIQSMNAHCGAPDLAVYSASKGALQTLTKNAANGHMADHIRVNGINLGWVDTQTERELHDVQLGKGEGWLEEVGKSLPIGRFVSEQDAARLVVFLLSDVSVPMSGVSMDLEQWVAGAPT